jgi:hypothetical protein
MTEIISFLAGVFGGSGAVLLWELALRPWVQGRAVAEVLSAEVSQNLEYLTAASMLAMPKSIPGDFSLGTAVFASLTDRIGDLPPDLVGEVVFLYRYFEELNRMPSGFSESLRELRSHEVGSANHQACERELGAVVAVFNQTVLKAINRIQLVQPLLLKAAAPWWSLRGRRRRKSVQLDIDVLRQKIEKSLADRAAVAAKVAGREPTSG